uniref:ethylene-responsive transcription factor RAP2-11-like n=1 Tax=Erigeron canadensis TaxID=72917 RepID=UPI001CB98E94|nr:ethylene-responsive transcription factor RAP2-11-like [Erigeron canadensis]
MHHKRVEDHDDNNKTIRKPIKYLGVRQRPSGRWVSEIKDSTRNLRLWLGTYNGPEEAAMAYDSVARILRGRNAKTNFRYNRLITSQEEISNLIQRNPKLYHFLKHATMKKTISSSQNNTTQLVEETLACSSYYEDGFKVAFNPQNEDGALLKLKSSNGSCCKVYSSVYVAPSFNESKK